MSVCLKVLDVGQARENVQQTTQVDIEQSSLARVDSALLPQEELQNFSVIASGNDDLLRSLGTVLEKVRVIADVTAKAVDALAKASVNSNIWTICGIIGTQVHPYANVAWIVMNAVRKVCRACLMTPH